MALFVTSLLTLCLVFYVSFTLPSSFLCSLLCFRLLLFQFSSEFHASLFAPLANNTRMFHLKLHLFFSYIYLSFQDAIQIVTAFCNRNSTVHVVGSASSNHSLKPHCTTCSYLLPLYRKQCLSSACWSPMVLFFLC